MPLLAGPAAAQNATSHRGGGELLRRRGAAIAGTDARVTSILSNPDQDPHLFEASPSVARLLSAATIVVYNGADYDPWMAKLLAATRSPDRSVIVVADLVHRKAGDNPHLWYDPPTMPAFATALAAALSRARPGAQGRL